MALLTLKEHKYLIIGGTTKAATTSLFSYLADHPQICAANIKETRFFLDSDYPVPSKYRFEDGLDKYEEFFCHCSDSRLRMEATPDYIYSSGTPQKIKDSLPNVKLVFILREPVSRLISWYRFAKQMGRLPKQVTFDEYVEMQHNGSDRERSKQHMHALRHGCYSIYLGPYFDLFGRDRICVVFYEDLSRDSPSVVKEVCVFAGIDPEFYAGYNFKIFNRTEAMKNSGLHRAYKGFRFQVRKHTHNKLGIHAVLRRIRLLIEPIYLYLNTRPSEKPVISSSIKAFLDDYYSQEANALAHLLQRPVTWRSAE